MVRGFYNESLAGGQRFAARWRMRPALLVDLDCDLYTSSAQALRFVLESEILVPGSYVYLDDIMPWVWADKESRALEQKLAFQQATSEWGLTWQEVPLNASRRDHAWERPVLMLAGCDKCRRTNTGGGWASAAVAPVPPACMQPARDPLPSPGAAPAGQPQQQHEQLVEQAPGVGF